MTTRAADATIKGYYYQFDTSILKLLELSAHSDSITIEGIEDIDLNTATGITAVQCKYLSKPKFTNSAVREPIILMLDHFINTSTSGNLKYILYAHFENEIPGVELSLDIARLKAILTYRDEKVKKHYEIEKAITDTQLDSFLRNFKLVFGKEFNSQQQEVIQKLKNHFDCTLFEADALYYNNALRFVIDKAIKKNIKDRIIRKSEFISIIDCGEQLFNNWFIKLRSKQEYLKLSGQNLKQTKALDPVKSKIIVIGTEILQSKNAELPVEAFVENLVHKYFKPNSALRNAKPLTLVFDIDTSNLMDIKKRLIEKEIPFNDGFEHISFSSVFFNKEPVITTTKNGNKIEKASYLIKLISKQCFMNNCLDISQPAVFINFSKDGFKNKIKTSQFFDFKYCENLKDIHELLSL